MLWGALALLLFSCVGAFLAYQYKDKIIQVVVSELNKELNTKIMVEKIDMAFWETFPRVSLAFYHVEMQGSDPTDDTPLVKAGKLFLSFNIMELYGGNYQISETLIEDADLHFIISPNGSNNFTVLNKNLPSQEGSSVSFKLDKVKFKNVNVLFENRINEQEYDVYCRKGAANFSSKGRSWNVGLAGDLFVHKISVEKRDYMASKQLVLNASMVYEDTTGYYEVKPSDITIGNSLFNLEGRFGVRSGQDIELRLAGKQTSIQTILALLPEDIHQKLGVYKSQGNVYFNGTLKGKVDSHHAPEAVFMFGCDHVSFWHPDYSKKVENLSFKGFYSSGRKSEGQTSYLQLEGLEGTLDDRSFSADFELRNFADPYVKFSFNGSFNLESLVKVIGWSEVENVTGELSADLSFEGKQKDLNQKSTLTNITSLGNIQFKNTGLTLKSNGFQVKDLQALLSFDNTSLHLHDLSAIAQGEKMQIKGYVYNHLTYLAGTRRDLEGEMQLQADFLDLEKWLLMPKASKEKEGVPAILPTEEEAKFVFQCNVKRLVYKTFHTQDVKGRMTLQHKKMQLENVTTKAAGGHFTLDGTVDLSNKEAMTFMGKAKCTEVKVDSLFWLFDNFGQKFIVGENMKGLLNVSADVFIPFDQNYRIDPKTFKAFFNVSIKTGELNNFQPMQELSKFVDAKELYNLRFSELKNTIRVENEKIYIPEMEIKSNINTVYVLGTHGFDGQMDYKLKVSLKNYKKKDKDEAFGAIQEEGNNTMLFLTMKGKSGDLKIAYDTEAVKDKIGDSWKKEKEEFKNLFKPNTPINKEKNKPVEVKEDEYIDIN
jgi:hypothetical protein